MTAPTCTTPGCTRIAMRTREGRRVCLYCPDQPAPDMDLITGQLRGPDGKPTNGTTLLVRSDERAPRVAS